MRTKFDYPHDSVLEGKKLTLGSIFERLQTRHLIHQIRVDGSQRFKNIRIRVDGALSLVFTGDTIVSKIINASKNKCKHKSKIKHKNSFC